MALLGAYLCYVEVYPILRKALPAGLVLLALLPLLSACATRAFRPKGWSGVEAGESNIFVAEGQGRVVALALEDGARVWSFPPEGQDPVGPFYSAPLLGPTGLVFAGSYDGTVYAVWAGNGSQAWRFDTNGHIVARPALAGDTLLVPSSDGHLYALDPQNRGVRWKFPGQGKIGQVWSTPAVAGGVVYFGTLGHRVYAVRLSDGSEVWRRELEGAVTASPLVVGDRVVVGSFDRHLYALDAATGEVVGSFRGRNWFWAGAVYDGERVYAADLSGAVYALRPDSLQQVWRAEVEGAVVVPPVLVRGRLVVATDKGRVFVLDRGTGQVEWTYDIGAPVRSRLAVKGDRVFLVGMDNTVRALNAVRGTVLWSAQLGK